MGGCASSPDHFPCPDELIETPRGMGTELRVKARPSLLSSLALGLSICLQLSGSFSSLLAPKRAGHKHMWLFGSCWGGWIRSRRRVVLIAQPVLQGMRGWGKGPQSSQMNRDSHLPSLITLGSEWVRETVPSFQRPPAFGSPSCRSASSLRGPFSQPHGTLYSSVPSLCP